MIGKGMLLALLGLVLPVFLAGTVQALVELWPMVLLAAFVGACAALLGGLHG